MARKKSSSKKINLSNLDDALTTTTAAPPETPNLTETTEDLAQNPLEVKEDPPEEPLETSPEEPLETPPEVKATPPEEPLETSPKETLKTPPEVKVTPLAEPRKTIPEVKGTVPEREGMLSPPPSLTKNLKLDRRPQRPKPQQLQTVPEATNDGGELFKPGDKITVRAPWGGQAIAEIAGFYKDNTGGIWAEYNPVSALPHKWTWNGGATRAKLLQKAEN